VAVPLGNIWEDPWMAGIADNGQEYYLPPMPLSGLARLELANAQHGSCLVFRRNMIAACYKSGGLRRKEFRALVKDVLTFGNGYVEQIRNGFGQVRSLRHIPAINMRVRTGGRGYVQLQSNGTIAVDFPWGSVLHVKEYDTVQQIYGKPDWMGGMQSALLNQEATLFRRKYYVNGAHLGYILYSNDAKLSKDLQKKITEEVKKGKGIGNFGSVYFHIPNGGEKAFQIIPVGDISQKDEFKSIKSMTAADVREAHRVPPALLGFIPEGNASVGDPAKVFETYKKSEVIPGADLYLDLNEELPADLQLKFDFDLEVKE
jgi:PBSX family phage portal protein